MAIEKVKAYFAQFGMEERVMEAATSSATVEEAAATLGCGPERIAKTLSFRTDRDVILVVTAGDQKIDNKKYRAQFDCKAHMLKFEEVESLIGHGVGGVCPFAVNEGVKVYTVFPAAGSSNSMIELTIPELERYSNSCGWVDVCKER